MKARFIIPEAARILKNLVNGQVLRAMFDSIDVVKGVPKVKLAIDGWMKMAGIRWERLKLFVNPKEIIPKFTKR